MNPSKCPLCKCTVVFDISDDKNLKLVKCDECKDFVITYEAEQSVIKAPVQKALLSKKSQSMTDNEMLYIFINDHKLDSQPIGKAEWEGLKGNPLNVMR